MSRFPPQLRSPAWRRLALILGCLACWRGLPAAPDLPFFADPYRGNDTVLAYLNGAPLTERDLYVFLLLAGTANATLPEGWNSEEWAAVRAERRAEVRWAVEQMAKVLILGDRPSTGSSPYVDFLRNRWALYPVYLLVWTDEIVAPEVQIYPEDVSYYIREHPRQFYLPERLQFYWAWFASPASDPPGARRATQERAEDVLQLLNDTGGASLATVAADYPPSTTLVPESLVYTAPVGSIQLDPLVEAAVREGKVRQPSPVIETRDGFSIVELKARLPEISRPQEEIRTEARDSLFHRSLPHQFDYRLANLRRAIHPVDRTPLWEFLADDTVLLDVGRTDVTKQDFRLLFPDLFANPLRISKAALRARAREFTDREVIAQDVEAHLLDADPSLQRARVFSRALLGYRRVLLPIQQETYDTAATSTLWQQEGEQLWPPFEYHYYRISLRLPPSTVRAPERERGDQIAQALRFLATFREEISDILAVYRAPSEESPQTVDVSPILTRWQRRFGAAYSVGSDDLGFRAPAAPNPIANAPFRELPRLDVGEVSQPRYEPPGILTMYFVSQKRPRGQPTQAQIREMVVDRLRALDTVREGRRAFEDALNDGRFRWAPQLNP